MGYSPQGLKELDTTKVTEDRARYRTLQVGLSGKESACQVGDLGSIPGSGRSTGEGIGYPLQYSCASLVAQLVKNLPAVWETWVFLLLLHMKSFYKLVVLLLQNHLLLMYVCVCVLRCSAVFNFLQNFRL